MKRSSTLLGFALLLLALVAVWFHQRQNSGAMIGGAISLPKMLWLTYAIAAWFVVPPFLAADARLGPRFRRGFLWFSVFMFVRGIGELIAIYAFGHWHPLIGIVHDLVAVGLVVVCFRGLTPSSTVERLSRRFAGTLVVTLLIEAAFAAIFLQSAAHAEGVYFVPTGGSWTFVNLMTWVALAFALPDLVLFLVGYLRLEPPVLSRWVTRARNVVAIAVLCVSATGLVTWTRMERAEASAKRFEAVGFGIFDSCLSFNEAFGADDRVAMLDFTVAGGGEMSWERVPVDHPHEFEFARWAAQGPTRSLADGLNELRAAHPELEQSAFKIHLLEEHGERTATATLRFEVTSDTRTDAGLVRAQFTQGDDGRWRVRDSELVEGTTVSGSGDLFVDVADERGLDFVMGEDLRFVPHAACEAHDCEHVGPLRFQTMRHAYAGVAAADIDGDHDDDLFLCSGGVAAVYRNTDGRFTDVTDDIGIGELWHVNTAGFADLDGDGDQDLFCGSFFGENRLFENDGTGHFVDVTEASGLGRDDMVTCFAFFDHDGDGDLDLYLGRFLDARREIPGSFLYARNGERDILYSNEGDLSFTDVTEHANIGDHGLALSVAAADYDEDGDQDLYVANDFGRNVLFKNRGDGVFDEVSKETGTYAIGGSMSASWGDYDGDGRLDLYVAAIRSNQRWYAQPQTARRIVHKFLREGRFNMNNPLLSDLRDFLGDRWTNVGNHALAGNSLLRQRDDGTFEDMAERAGARPAGWYWSSGFLDFDHDGDLDVFASDGWITGADDHDL